MQTVYFVKKGVVPINGVLLLTTVLLAKGKKYEINPTPASVNS